MLSNQIWLVGAALLVSATLAGCTSKSDAEDKSPPTETASLESMPVSPAGREFLTATFEMGLLEISAAKLAMEKSQSSQVKRFAELMYASYARANDSLRQLAWAHDLDLPSEPNQKGQALLQKLSELDGVAFDQVYSHEMRKAHKRATQRFNAAADSAPDPVVQAFARSQLPAMRDRFRLASTLPD
jgi:putative membrane protein